MNGASGFNPPLYWFYYYSGALESFDDYDYGDVLRGLRALGVRYMTRADGPGPHGCGEGPGHLAKRHPTPAGPDCDNPRPSTERLVFELPAVGWRAARERARNGPQYLVPGSPPQRRTARMN